MSEDIRGSWPTWARYVACYSMWFALSALAGWTFLRLRSNLIDGAVFLGADRWVLPAVHNFGVVVFGLVFLGVVVGIEAYLHDGVKRHDLIRRARGVLVPLLVVLVLTYAFGLVVPSLGL